MSSLPGPRIHGTGCADNPRSVVPAGPGGPRVLDGVWPHLAGIADRDRTGHVPATQCSSDRTHTARVHGSAAHTTCRRMATAAAAAVASAGGNATAAPGSGAIHRNR